MVLRGKRIAILGFGKEGESLLGFLYRQGARDIAVLDRDARLEREKIERLDGRAFLGRDYLKGIGGFDLIFRSPGVPLGLPPLGKVRSRLTSSTRLFFELSPTKNIIGVTGTKGKGTTASLIYQILRGRYKRVFLAGNIGRPMLDLLPRLRSNDWVVLELSSFQLEDLTTSPRLAVLLNVVPEHLKEHGTFRRYLAAKSNIFRYQKAGGSLVTNFDHFALRNLVSEAPAKVFLVSRFKSLPKGVFIERGRVVSTLSGRQVILELRDFPLLGEHNLENLLPAVAAGLLAKVSPVRIAKAVKRFRSLPHRLEAVGEKGGVSMVNDSMATTPQASLAGVRSYTRPIALIAGGKDKGSDWRKWAEGLAASDVIFVALIGETAPQLEAALRKYAPAIKRKIFPTLPKAVQGAYAVLGPLREGVLLLSPGCASLDMFRNFEERGERFKEIVRSLR